MSKGNKTLDDLLNNISQEWSWRIKELDDFKTGFERTKDYSIRSTFIRAGITLLYAHWEGFIKKCSSNYYNYVTTKGLKINKLHDSFIAISLRKELNDIIDSNKISIQSKAISILLSEFEKRASFPSDIPLKTSNMNYEVFKEYCIMCGIDISLFETKRNFINIRLLENRNTIAHGKYLSIEERDFVEIYQITIELMKNFKDTIENSASLGLYKRRA